MDVIHQAVGVTAPPEARPTTQAKMVRNVSRSSSSQRLVGMHYRAR